MFGGFTAVNRVSFDVTQGEILGLIGPERLGQEHHLQSHRRRAAPTAGSIRFLGREIAGHRHIASRTTASDARIRSRVRSGGCRCSRTWRSPPTTARSERPSREKAFAQAREALELVGLPADPAARVDGLGAAALKKLELARALATQPKLLLADESLGGLDETEMEQAADLLARIRAQRGITIVWVEHIMGVLMRVVDRCVVLDHGEVIAQGKPQRGGARSAGSSRSTWAPTRTRCRRPSRRGAPDALACAASPPATPASRRCSTSASRSRPARPSP